MSENMEKVYDVIVVGSGPFGMVCDLACTKRVQAPLFSPFFSGKAEKNGPPEA